MDLLVIIPLQSIGSELVLPFLYSSNMLVLGFFILHPTFTSNFESLFYANWPWKEKYSILDSHSLIKTWELQENASQFFCFRRSLGDHGEGTSFCVHVPYQAGTMTITNLFTKPYSEWIILRPVRKQEEEFIWRLLSLSFLFFSIWRLLPPYTVS